MAVVYSWSLNNGGRTYIIDPSKIKDTDGSLIPPQECKEENLIPVYSDIIISTEDETYIKKWVDLLDPITEKNKETHPYVICFNKMLELEGVKRGQNMFLNADDYFNAPESCDNLMGPFIDKIEFADKELNKPGATDPEHYVDYVAILTNGNRIPFKIQRGKDGKVGRDGKDGINGKDGRDGEVSIISRTIDAFITCKVPGGPGAPQGGSWDSNTNKVDYPTGWGPEGSTVAKEKPIWKTSRTFYKKGINMSYVDTGWCEPYQISGEDGENGADGRNIEFSYILMPEETIEFPKIVDSDLVSPSLTEKVSGKWFDNPQGISEKFPVEWVSSRKKDENGAWNSWGKPVIWSRWGTNGMDGDGVQFIYLSNNGEHPKNPTPNGFETDSEYQNQKTEWIPNEKMPDQEYINLNGDSINTAKWKWTDEPSGVTSENKQEWVSIRKRTMPENEAKSKWTAYSEPAPWANFAEKGKDGGTTIVLYMATKPDDKAPSLVPNATVTEQITSHKWTRNNVSFDKGYEKLWSISTIVDSNEKLLKDWDGPFLVSNYQPEPLDFSVDYFCSSETEPSKLDGVVNFRGDRYIVSEYDKKLMEGARIFNVTSLPSEWDKEHDFLFYGDEYYRWGNDIMSIGSNGEFIHWDIIPIGKDSSQWWRTTALISGWDSNIIKKWGIIKPYNGRDGESKEGSRFEKRYAFSDSENNIPNINPLEDNPNTNQTLKERTTKWFNLSDPVQNEQISNILSTGMFDYKGEQVKAACKWETEIKFNSNGEKIGEWSYPWNINGKDGKNGEKGENGPAGPMGPVGSAGPQGISGVPGVGFEIQYKMGTVSAPAESLEWSFTIPDEPRYEAITGEPVSGAKSLEVSKLPDVQNTKYDYLIYNGVYYEWPENCYLWARQAKGRYVRIEKEEDRNITVKITLFDKGSYTNGSYIKLAGDIKSFEEGDRLKIGELEIYVDSIEKSGNDTNIYFVESLNDDSIKIGPQVIIRVARLIYDWDLAKPFRTTGIAGNPGEGGQMVYPAGIYNPHETYRITGTSCPYVYYDGIFYVLKVNSFNEIPEGSSSVPRSGGPGDFPESWTKMEGFEAIYADVGVFNTALVGSAVFNKGYVFSQAGINSTGLPTSDYEKFAIGATDPYNPVDGSTPSFRPNYCTNFQTGEVWMNAGKTRFKPDGSGYIANKNIEWKNNGDISLANGNAEFKSNFSGNIGKVLDKTTNLPKPAISWDTEGNVKIEQETFGAIKADEMETIPKNGKKLLLKNNDIIMSSETGDGITFKVTGDNLSKRKKNIKKDLFSDKEFSFTKESINSAKLNEKGEIVYEKSFNLINPVEEAPSERYYLTIPPVNVNIYNLYEDGKDTSGTYDDFFQSVSVIVTAKIGYEGTTIGLVNKTILRENIPFREIGGSREIVDGRYSTETERLNKYEIDLSKGGTIQGSDRYLEINYKYIIKGNKNSRPGSMFSVSISNLDYIIAIPVIINPIFEICNDGFRFLNDNLNVIEYESGENSNFTLSSNGIGIKVNKNGVYLSDKPNNVFYKIIVSEKEDCALKLDISDYIDE